MGDPVFQRAIADQVTDFSEINHEKRHALPKFGTATGVAEGAGRPCEFGEPGRLRSHQDQSSGSSAKGS